MFLKKEEKRMERVNAPKVIYHDESETELMKKLCDVAPETDKRMSNIKLSVPLGVLVIGKENKDSWIASYRIYHGWNVVISEQTTTGIQL